ncbi:hypothetical protein Bbelb_398430 [Branchiostoma belcheri]|nr:hypothetical protein Bbelb_398430 [Branchiostoma belcheri]
MCDHVTSVEDNTVTCGPKTVLVKLDPGFRPLITSFAHLLGPPYPQREVFLGGSIGRRRAGRSQIAFSAVIYGVAGGNGAPLSPYGAQYRRAGDGCLGGDMREEFTIVRQTYDGCDRALSHKSGSQPLPSAPRRPSLSPRKMGHLFSLSCIYYRAMNETNTGRLRRQDVIYAHHSPHAAVPRCCIHNGPTAPAWTASPTSSASQQTWRRGTGKNFTWRNY